MTLFGLLQSSPLAFSLLAGILGLLVGSFLNVVIYRTPILLMRRWRRDCQELAGQAIEADNEKFNLIVPR